MIYNCGKTVSLRGTAQNPGSSMSAAQGSIQAEDSITQ